jgi:hypothetical protein
VLPKNKEKTHILPQKEQHDIDVFYIIPIANQEEEEDIKQLCWPIVVLLLLVAGFRLL